MQTLDWTIRYAQAMHGDRLAIVDGDTRLTYLQFGERCRKIGQALIGLGVKPGDRVGVLLENSHRYLEMHLAIPGIGAVIVPINSRLAPAEMLYILQDSGARLLVTDKAHELLHAALAGAVERLIVAPNEYEALLNAAPLQDLPGPRSESDPAGLYYTGGTTGLAKGVILSHRNLIAETNALALGDFATAPKSFLYVFPLFHLGGICAVYFMIYHGAKHVFMPAIDPERILRVIEAERIEYTAIVPTVLNLMVNHPIAKMVDTSSLRQISHGAAPIAPSLCRKLADTFSCRLVQAYGMTEASAVATLLHDEQALLDSPRIRSAGRAVPGLECIVRRPDGSPCNAGEPGEITLRGETIMQGYWNKPQETALTLRDGWYWTGDIGYLDEEQYLYVIDRAKDMIVSGGENIYSVEVESALSSHPGVLECAVIGIPNEKWGESVHAVVYARPGVVLTAVELIDHCRSRIASYKCPKSISFSGAELPKSSVGKILKKDLRHPYWEGKERGIA